MSRDWHLTVDDDGHFVDGTLSHGRWYLSCSCGWDGFADHGMQDDEILDHLDEEES